MIQLPRKHGLNRRYAIKRLILGTSLVSGKTVGAWLVYVTGSCSNTQFVSLGLSLKENCRDREAAEATSFLVWRQAGTCAKPSQGPPAIDWGVGAGWSAQPEIHAPLKITVCARMAHTPMQAMLVYTTPGHGTATGVGVQSPQVQGQGWHP